MWIAYLRDSRGPEVEVLDRLIEEGRAATTDVVLLEVLVGTTDEERAAQLRRFLAGTELLRRQSPVDVEHAAALYRACRRDAPLPEPLPRRGRRAAARRRGAPPGRRLHRAGRAHGPAGGRPGSLTGVGR